MLCKDDLWLVEEPAVDEPADVLAIPQLRNYLSHELPDDELGLRSLLERPEALVSAWWGADPYEGQRGHARHARRRHHGHHYAVVHAA